MNKPHDHTPLLEQLGWWNRIAAADPPRTHPLQRIIAFRICLDEVTAAMGTICDDLIERCRLALRAKYRRYLYPQAEALLDAEVVLVRSKNFEDALIQMLDYGDRLQQRSSNFHVVGSGASSIILYVMGMS